MYMYMGLAGEISNFSLWLFMYYLQYNSVFIMQWWNSTSLSLSFFRERTVLVYSIYSRKPPAVIHSLLAGLKVTHVVIEDVWCSKKYRPGCALYEVWDNIDHDNQDKQVFCELVKDHTPDQFKLVFLNKSYRILQLL